MLTRARRVKESPPDEVEERDRAAESGGWIDQNRSVAVGRDQAVRTSDTSGGSVGRHSEDEERETGVTRRTGIWRAIQPPLRANVMWISSLAITGAVSHPASAGKGDLPTSASTPPHEAECALDTVHLVGGVVLIYEIDTEVDVHGIHSLRHEFDSTGKASTIVRRRQDHRGPSYPRK